MVEKGRLYSLQNGSTEDCVYFVIKQKQFLFGSSECCTVRMYIDGIFPKHCVLTIGDQRKAYIEPLHPSALTYVNGIKIKHKVLLENDDVITIFVKEFQFTYSPNNLSGDVSIERLLALPCTKEVKLAQKFETTWNDDRKSFCLSKDFSIPVKIFIPIKLICMFKSDILKKIPEYLLIFAQKEPIDTTYNGIRVQESNSCCEKSLARYTNQYVEESSEPRRNLAVKLYEFFCFMKDSINRNGECSFDLLQLSESVWKCSIYKASGDTLLETSLDLSLTSLFPRCLKSEVTVHKKYLQSKMLSSIPNKLSSSSSVELKKKNHCVKALGADVPCNYKYPRNIEYDGYSITKAGWDVLFETCSDLSLKYLSPKFLNKEGIAVHKKSLESRKLSDIPNKLSSIFVMKSEKKNQSLKPLDICKSPNNSEGCGKKENQHMVRKNSISYKKRVSLAVKRYHLRKRKSIMMAKSTGNESGQSLELSDPEKENFEKLVDSSSENKMATLKSRKRKEKQSYMNKSKKCLVKETVADLIDDSSGNLIATLKPRKQKQVKEKQSSKNKGSVKENIVELVDDSCGNQIATLESRTLKEKQIYKNKGLIQEFKNKFLDYSSGEHKTSPIKANSTKQSYKNKKKGISANKSAKAIETLDTQNLQQCQRITRSMAKNYH